MAIEGLGDAEKLEFRKWIGDAARVAEQVAARGLRRRGENPGAVLDEPLPGRMRPIPFQQGEFGMMQPSALAISERVRERKNPLLAGRKQFFGCEFRRGMQVKPRSRSCFVLHLRGECADMGFVAGRYLQNRRINLDERHGVEKGAHGGRHLRARPEIRPPVVVDIRPPPGRGGAHGAISLEKRGGTWLAIGRKMDARSSARFSSRRVHGLPPAGAVGRIRKIIASVPIISGIQGAAQRALASPRRIVKGKTVKVIASSIRKGNIIEREDGQLYVVLTAESFHPGKGTPTTQIDMRRLSDGVKTTDRYKTTEQVERAYVEDSTFSYLYQDADGYTFMNGENFDQVIVPPEVIGDQSIYLQEGMNCVLSMFNGVPVGIQLPARVTLEVVETEPAMKGQTASSSYKPAKLSNGARAMVPPHISPGTRIVVQTEDGSYVERAKD